MPPIQTLIFDLGGVLIDWNPRYCFERLDSTGSRIDTFLREVATHDWNSTLDRGVSFDAAIQARSREFPEWSSWLDKWKTEWPTMLKGPIHEMVDVLERAVEAKRSGRLSGVYALSNWSEMTFEIAKARFPFLSHFDGIVISGREKVAKPDPEIFHLLMNRYQIVSETSAFIDDVRKNIETAQALGFRTFHFVEPSTEQVKQLYDWLSEHSVWEKT